MHLTCVGMQGLRCHDCGCNTCALVPDDAGTGCASPADGACSPAGPARAGPSSGAGDGSGAGGPRRRMCAECGTPNDAACVLCQVRVRERSGAKVSEVGRRAALAPPGVAGRF